MYNEKFNIIFMKQQKIFVKFVKTPNLQNFQTPID